MGGEFQVRLRAGFHDLARDFPDRCHLIDGNRAPEVIAAEIAGMAGLAT
jgi:dTMP kinase